ncbi:MAG: hypothetical protein AAF404_10965 [Pseudomonadota bacterium]
MSATCRILTLGAILLLTACSATTPAFDNAPEDESRRVQSLDRALLALGPDVDPFESKRAARIAIGYSKTLATEYDLAGSPLFHNLMVQFGARERGLCIHWTTDLMARLKQENFQSLDLHRAIANYETLFRFEHSSVIISAKGDTYEDGLVLDPWRNSGVLHWAPTLADSGYRWEPRAEVHQLKRLNQATVENRQALR